MNLPSTWKAYFESRILSRGKSYFQEGAIRSLEETESGVSAIVEGSDSYSVEIGVADDRFEMSCTCPYAREWGPCKHMAAVCFAIEMKETHHPDTSEPQLQSLVRCSKPSVSVDAVSAEQLRDFLRYLISTDDRIQAEFNEWMYDDYSESDLKYKVSQLSGIVDDIFEEYAQGYDDDYYFHSNYDALENDDSTEVLRESVCKFVAHLIYHKHYDFVFSVLCSVSNYATSKYLNGRFTYDDSGERANKDIQEILLGLLAELLKQPISSELHERIYDWICSILKDIANDENGTIDLDFLIWTLFFSEISTPDEEKKVLMFVDELLEINVTELLLKKKFQLMDSLGFSLEEIESAEEQYSSEYYICNRRIDRACAVGNYAGAATFLERYISQFSSDGVEIGLKRRLGDLYVQAKDIESSAAIRKSILSSKHMAISDYRAYRTLFSPKEWKGKRDEAISLVPKNSLNDVLFEEKLYDRLVSRLIGSPYMGEVMKYEQRLGQMYPREFAELRVAIAKEMMTSASTRAQYRQAVMILSEALVYPEGTALVTEIIRHWLEIYPRHRALWDEVNKRARLHRIWSSITGK